MTFNLSQWANTQSPAIPCQLVPPDLYQFQRRAVSALQAPAAPVTPGKLSPAVGAPMLSPKDLATVNQARRRTKRRTRDAAAHQKLAGG